MLHVRICIAGGLFFFGSSSADASNAGNISDSGNIDSFRGSEGPYVVS